MVFQNSHGREGDLTRVTEDGGHAAGRSRIGVSRIGVANGNVAILAIDGFTIHCGVATWRGVMIIGVIVVVVHVIVPSGIIIIGVIVIALGGGVGGGGRVVVVVVRVTTVAAVVIVTVVESPRGVGGRAEDGAGLGRLAITGTTETRGQAGTHDAVPVPAALLVGWYGRRDGQLPIHTSTGLARTGPTHMMGGHVARIAGRGVAYHGVAGGSARRTTVPA